MRYTSNLKGLLIISFGTFLVAIFASSLFGYYAGEVIEIQDYRFGNLSGWVAISFHIGAALCGLLFIIWGAALLLGKSNETT